MWLSVARFVQLLLHFLPLFGKEIRKRSALIISGNRWLPNVCAIVEHPEQERDICFLRLVPQSEQGAPV